MSVESTPGVFAVWQDFCAAAKDHIESAKLLGIPMKPKHHWLLEMGVRSRLQGSPGWVSCWSDESINKCLKDVAAGAHSAHFHERVLIHFDVTVGHGSKRPRTG